MGISAVDAGAKVDMSSELAIKVVKDQLKMQQQMAAALMQPTLVYSADGTVQAVPPQSSFNVQM